MLIAHTADLHFGRRALSYSSGGDNQRELDIYAAGQAVAEYLAQLQPDVAVIAGDVWDSGHPSPQALRHGYDFHRTLREADIPTLVIGGNHDTLATPGRPNPLQHLERYFGCRLALEQTAVELAGVLFHCVPYRTLAWGEYETPAYEQDTPNVLVAHAAADGDNLPAFAAYDATRLSRTELLHPGAQLQLLGHIHIHQQIGEHAYYCGALERLRYDEITNTPAIYLHRLHEDGQVETESVPVSDMGVEGVPRPVHDLQLEAGELDPEQVVEAANALIDQAEMDGHLVRLQVLQGPRDLAGLHWEEPLAQRARSRGALDLRCFVRARDAQLIEVAPRDAGPQLAPGAALSEAYRQFAAQTGDGDLAELGCELIAEALGEKS